MSIAPNSTQVPNRLLDEWMPRLKDVELRVLLVIVRQTLGWIEDSETGRRKEKDWISRTQLVSKTGRSSRAVSPAIETLCQYQLIQTISENGGVFETPAERKDAGEKIFYRLHTALRSPTIAESSIPTIAKSAHGGWQKVPSTKETPIQKKLLRHENHVAVDNTVDKKSTADFKAFIDFYYRECQRLRGLKPIITGMDGRNLKRVLSVGVSEPTLEQVAVYFLAYYRDFSPSISTLLSAGVLNGMLNRMKNEEGFWKRLDQALATSTTKQHAYETRQLSDAVLKMRQSMAALGNSKRITSESIAA